MLDLEEALATILAAIEFLPSEAVPLYHARGRIAREDVAAGADLPPFDNSAMDGYAVRAADLAGANAISPARLRLIGSVPAGEMFPGKVEPGQCVRLFTGSPLPEGADAVVMQEDVQALGPDDVSVLDTVQPWENVRFRGEDIKAGTPVVSDGELLTSGRIGLLAATGRSEVRAGCNPKVALLSTGNELCEPGVSLVPGRIYESNRVMLHGLVEQCGGRPDPRPIVPDTLPATVEAISNAMKECDAIITTGGVSVGEFDFVKAAWEQAGGQMDFWKVAVRPGKPFVFGRGGGKLLFGLPGNPVSALVTFWLLVRPALLRWQGAADVGPKMSRGVLAEPLVNRGDRPHFVRVISDAATGAVRSSGLQASHVFSSLAKADGLVRVPPTTTMAEGLEVEVLLLD